MLFYAFIYKSAPWQISRQVFWLQHSNHLQNGNLLYYTLQCMPSRMHHFQIFFFSRLIKQKKGCAHLTKYCVSFYKNRAFQLMTKRAQNSVKWPHNLFIQSDTFPDSYSIYRVQYVVPQYDFLELVSICSLTNRFSNLIYLAQGC